MMTQFFAWVDNGNVINRNKEERRKDWEDGGPGVMSLILVIYE